MPSLLRWYTTWQGVSTLWHGRFRIDVVSGHWIGIEEAGLYLVLNLMDILLELNAEGSAKLLTSFIDNIEIVCKRSRGPELLATLIKKLADAELYLKPTVKVMSLSRSHFEDDTGRFPLPPEYAGESMVDPVLARVNVTAVDEIRFMGVLVAHDEADELQFVRDRLAKLVRRARRIVRVGKHQVELLLLRYMFLSPVVYLLRNSVPHTVAPALEDFDRDMRQILAEWLEQEELVDVVYEQALLPIRRGGLSFYSSAEVVWPAFAASVEAFQTGVGPSCLAAPEGQ
jgi:hypothetical protein